MDPYKILNVDKNCNIDQLRRAFKKVACKVHPDKGGNEEMFNIVVESYKAIFKSLKGSENKDFHELKKNSKESFPEFQKKHVSFSFSADTQKEHFKDKFNRVFEENRVHFPAVDDGYGHIMEKTSSIREDISIEKTVKKSSDFNSNFDDQEPMNKELVKYKEPVALIASKKLTYDELGTERVDDYSSDSNKRNTLAYCDYLKAHTTNKLVDKKTVAKREDYNTFDDIKTSRKNQSFEITEEDKKNIEESLEKEKKRELRRRLVMKEHDKLISAQFDRVNKQMLN